MLRALVVVEAEASGDGDSQKRSSKGEYRGEIISLLWYAIKRGTRGTWAYVQESFEKFLILELKKKPLFVLMEEEFI